MSLESTLFSTLNALAPAGGVWQGHTRDADNCPRIVFSQVASVPNLDFAYGPPSFETARIQIDCYDVTQAGARALADSVKAAMVALQPSTSNWPINDMYQYEQDVKQDRIVLEYGIRR